MIIRSLLLSSAAAAGLLFATAAQAQESGQTPPVGTDVRSTLSPGLHDAGQAVSNLTLEHSVRPAPGFFDPEALFAPPTPEEAEAAQARAAAVEAGTAEPLPPPRYSPLALANSDMAMSDGRLFVGSFHGFNAYDVTGEGAPELVLSVVCPGGQGDVSVHGGLLFMSVEQNRARLDCGVKDAEGEVNAERFRGIRIFDISDLSAPRQIAAVQTCRGSHTHTLVPHPSDPKVLYIYNSATSGVRKSDELAICQDGEPGENPETALYSIDVIKVPLDAPEQAAIVNRPRIFADRETGEIAGLWKGGRYGVAGQESGPTNHCHDITVYPELDLAAGACSGNGLLLDISDPENPARISELFDPDMAYWHSATFNAVGDKVLFTDEWGGGTSARCRAEDPHSWGADLIATIEDGRLAGQSFFKLPAAQAASENCVAHNGNIIPVPGRDLMVQAWYQGGVSIVDFTDPARPVEIAWFDRGPIDAERLKVGGAWSAYWFNGRIYASEIARGFDVLRLKPSEHLSAAEIAVAERVMQETINPQTQTRPVWEDHPDVAAAYLDQLTRSNGIDAAPADRARAVIDQWRQGDFDKARAAELARTLAAAAAAEAAAEDGDKIDAARLASLAGVLERVAR
ncbi:MAG TPA: hypothetical protein VFF66_05075 [Brevundimonas sp.]|nr:hypothetical protein [Brevundimonas sp.]